MRVRVPLLLALALGAACAGVEGDLKRAAMKEFFVDFVKGKDRGAGEYARVIEKSITPLQGGRYQYIVPAHISHYMILRSVQGLGGTRTEDADYMAFVVDRLFYVLAHDPMGNIRSEACEQLGRVLLRLPQEPDKIIGGDISGDGEINQIALDLKNYGDAISAGKKVTAAQVLERMDRMGEHRPSTFASARQMMRAFAAKPVVASTSASIRERAAALVPGITRDCILVALREAAFGDPAREDIDPDPSPMVRAAAVRVLGRVGTRDALDLAIARTADSIDPAERDVDVLREIVVYLGAVGGKRAFEACILRLEDKYDGIRYQAQIALQRMTGARVEPTVAAWRAWQRRHPDWATGATPPAAETGEPPRESGEAGTGGEGDGEAKPK
jgi:hypothetical protein